MLSSSKAYDSKLVYMHANLQQKKFCRKKKPVLCNDFIIFFYLNFLVLCDEEQSKRRPLWNACTRPMISLSGEDETNFTA